MTELTTRKGAPLGRLTFGTMQFGSTADADESRAMYDAARDAGITDFDTAVGYADGASATLAVRWVMTHLTGSSPVISARSVHQLRPSLAAQDFDMPPALYDHITALSVTPPPATDRLEEA